MIGDWGMYEEDTKKLEENEEWKKDMVSGGRWGRNRLRDGGTDEGRGQK